MLLRLRLWLKVVEYGIIKLAVYSSSDYDNCRSDCLQPFKSLPTGNDLKHHSFIVVYKILEIYNIPSRRHNILIFTWSNCWLVLRQVNQRTACNIDDVKLKNKTLSDFIYTYGNSLCLYLYVKWMFGGSRIALESIV